MTARGINDSRRAPALASLWHEAPRPGIYRWVLKTEAGLGLDRNSFLEICCPEEPLTRVCLLHWLSESGAPSA